MEKNSIRVIGKYWKDELDYGLYYEPLIGVLAETGDYECADDVWDAFDKLQGVDRSLTWLDEFNIFPNVDKALDIIRKEDNFILFGKWILTCNMTCEAFEKLDELDLVPYFGYNYTYSEFLQK